MSVAGQVCRLAEKGCTAIGTLISLQSIEAARRRYAILDPVEANGEDLPFDDDSFNLITSIGSLEHYINPEIGLREILRVAKPGAKIFIILPNSYFLFDILAVTFTGGCKERRLQIQE